MQNLMPIQDNKSRLDVGHHMGERVFLLNILGIVIIKYPVNSADRSLFFLVSWERER